FVVDDEGEKLSKSKDSASKGYTLPKNAEDFQRLFGADVIRLWIASVDFTDDIPVSKKRFDEIAEVYKKWRNTFRYLLGALADFDPATPETRLWEIDRWALHRLAGLASRVESLMN